MLPVLVALLAQLPSIASKAQPPKSDAANGFVQARQLLASDPDSALAIALKATAHLDELPMAWKKARALMLLGEAREATGDAPEALTAYQRAQTLLDKELDGAKADTATILARADLQISWGMLYFNLHEPDKCVPRFNAALGILDAVHDVLSVQQLNRRKVQAFNNIAATYIRDGDYATALPFFKQAVEMNRPLDNRRYESALNNNIGICYMEMGQHDLARQYFLQAYAVRKQNGDLRGQAQVLNNLGKDQALTGHFATAVRYFEEALALGRSLGNRESMAISLESLSSAYDTLGEYKKSLEAFRAFKTLNDSLYDADTRTTIARLEDQFRRDKERKVFELEAQRKDAESARRRIWNIALAGTVVLVLLIAFLILKVMRQRMRNAELEQQALRLESDKLAAERSALQESLEHKDRELAANALFLLKRNELIGHIADRLLKAMATFRQEDQKLLRDVIHELQGSQDEDTWKEFEAHFTRVHSTFYQTLQERFPALTPNERKLCAFLRLNMSTKDISAITHQSPNSITVARSRLRKKLQIDGEDVQLIDFLQSI
jgi:tetratricopeptide (TPR) repeat protein